MEFIYFIIGIISICGGLFIFGVITWIILELLFGSI